MNWTSSLFVIYNVWTAHIARYCEMDRQLFGNGLLDKQMQGEMLVHVVQEQAALQHRIETVFLYSLAVSVRIDNKVH